MPRLFDGLVFSKMKETLVDNMCRYQIGAKPGHRAQEHIFVLNSVLEVYKMKNHPLIVQVFDISRYFDRHTLLEVMHWLADASIPDKLYRLVWHLNSNTRVQVKSGAGISGIAVTKENLGQGSKYAGGICSMSLSKSTNRFFHDSKHEVSYGSVPLAPLLYQDDGLRVTSSVEGAREGCRRFEMVMDSKSLDCNIDKSSYLITGRKKVVEKIRDELKR